MEASGNEDHHPDGGERSNTKLYPTWRQEEKGEIEKMSESAPRVRHLSNQTDRSSGGGGGEDEEVSAEPEATATASRGRTRKQQERNKEVM